MIAIVIHFQFEEGVYHKCSGSFFEAAFAGPVSEYWGGWGGRGKLIAGNQEPQVPSPRLGDSAGVGRLGRLLGGPFLGRVMGVNLPLMRKFCDSRFLGAGRGERDGWFSGWEL